MLIVFYRDIFFVQVAKFYIDTFQVRPLKRIYIVKFSQKLKKYYLFNIYLLLNYLILGFSSHLSNGKKSFT